MVSNLRCCKCAIFEADHLLNLSSAAQVALVLPFLWIVLTPAREYALKVLKIFQIDGHLLLKVIKLYLIVNRLLHDSIHVYSLDVFSIYVHVKNIINKEK